GVVLTIRQNIFPCCLLIVVGIAIGEKVISIYLILVLFFIGITGAQGGGGGNSVTVPIEKTGLTGKIIASPGISYHIINLIKGKAGIIDIVCGSNKTDAFLILKVIQQSVCLVA